MKQDRWLRIIPVALIMYTISYVDRTNISLALDPERSGMMRDLLMDDKMKGHAAGIFFFGYVLLQIPGGYLANRWSAKKFISILLVFWGICAVGCGLVSTFRQFEVMRFLLGIAESGVFPATLVLLANWFPRSERARANAYWNLCQPLAVASSAPITGWLLGAYGWKEMIILEGALPFIWLPIWWYFISDRPCDAKWISREECDYIEKTLAEERAELGTTEKRDSASELVFPISMLFWVIGITVVASWPGLLWGIASSVVVLLLTLVLGVMLRKYPTCRIVAKPAVVLMLVIYFLQNCANYGLMTFLGEGLKSQGMKTTGFQYGVLFAMPYAVAALLMILNSRHSDKTRERRGHVALAYGVSGLCLIGSVLVRGQSFWASYALLCLAVPGPFSGLAPFWAIPAETMPRNVMGPVMGLVNAIGNLGGYLGPFIVGVIKKKTGGVAVPFSVLGTGLLVAAALCFLLPRTKAPGR